MIEVDSSFSQVEKPTKTLSVPPPPFAGYEPPLAAIEALARNYLTQKNIVVIGNGGSVASFPYFAAALGTEKTFLIVTTMEPDFLYRVRSRCPKDDTVIIAISKSGDTVGVIEALLYFIDYPSLIVVTESKPSALKRLQEHYGFAFLEHPAIGGRYSGFTPSGLLPAAVAGIDIRELWKGAKKGYESYGPKKGGNDAIRLASIMFELDTRGYSEIFMPIYSSRLLASREIITQLIHESVAKNGKGQTILACLAPESQHHTNQRFFGGKKNMLGCFIVVDEHEYQREKVAVPEDIRAIPLRDGRLVDLAGNSYAHALTAEFSGTWHDACKRRIPTVVVHLKKVTPASVGAYLAFWQYVTYYLCIFNGVDPFNQPEVESSKIMSFALRKKKG